MTDISGQAPRLRFCPSCGTQSDVDWRYCAGCGGRLPRLEDLHARLRPEQSEVAEAEPVPVPVIEPAAEPDVDAVPAAAVERAPEPGVDAVPAAAVEPRPTAPDTSARPTGSGHARSAEHDGEIRSPRTGPPRHGVTPKAEAPGDNPRRRRGRSDRIAALIEGPPTGGPDRPHAEDAPDIVAIAPETMIEALDAVAPQVTPPPAPADVPAADPADSVFLLDVPEHDQRDDHHSDDASDDRGSDGEIHLDPLVELPDGSGVRATGRSRGRVTTSVQFAALASAALGVALVAGLVQLNRRLESFATTGDAGPVDDADRLVERILQPAFFVCALVLVVGLVWWTRLRRFEMRALGIREARFSDGLAGASWLIPGANLVMSTMVLGEMWRTSRAVRRGGEWDDEPASPWLFSWALLVGAGAVVAIAAATVDPVTIPGIIDANTWSGIGYALMSLGLLALALTISAVARSVRVSLRVAQVQPDRLDVDLVEPDPVMA